MSDEIDPQLRQFKAWFKADREHSAKWRKAAIEDFEFLAGEQWTEADKAKMKDELRPIITFNRTHPIINSISGMEIVNRQEVKYFPREEGDAKANELLTEGAKWFRDQADADDEDSDAFLDAAVCGMGWTETTLDMEEDEEGAPTMEAVNPLEMYWDKAARQKNLADAERLWRVRQLPIARVKEMFPGKDVTEFDAKWAKADADDADDETQEQADRYQGDDDSTVERDQDSVTLVHLQYKTREPYYVVANQQGGPSSEVTAAQMKDLKQRADAIGMPIVTTKKTRMVVKNVFIGARILQGPDNALCKSHFSWQCVTAYKEHATGTFYGMMRLMKDPQRWANKWMSQALHILNSNAKGGLLAEKGVTDDARKFEKDWARTDKITWVEDGSLTNKKVQEKGQTAMPAGFFQMMEFAIQSVRDVTGVSVELLGMREANQAASLEMQRKQAGMTIIAPLFDNLKRYRRDHGKLMLYIIQNYLADGRLVRIVGENGAQYVPLALNADAKYDIIIDDQPNSPDQKMQIWQSLVQILPLLPPTVQLALVDFAPLPTSVIEKIKEAASALKEQGQIPPELQKQLADLAEENKQLKLSNESDMAKVQAQAEAKKAELSQNKELATLELIQTGELKRREIAQNKQLKLIEMGLEADTSDETGEEAAKPDPAIELQKQTAEMLMQGLNMLGQLIARNNEMTAQALAEVARAVTAPVVLDRDANGRPSGARKVMN
jgi:hypothetical protein